MKGEYENFCVGFSWSIIKGKEMAVLEVSNAALNRLEYSERFDADDCDRLYGMKWHEYFEWLLPNESVEQCLKIQASAHELCTVQPQKMAKFIHLCRRSRQ